MYMPSMLPSLSLAQSGSKERLPCPTHTSKPCAFESQEVVFRPLLFKPSRPLKFVVPRHSFRITRRRPRAALSRTVALSRMLRLLPLCTLALVLLLLSLSLGVAPNRAVARPPLELPVCSSSVWGARRGGAGLLRQQRVAGDVVVGHAAVFVVVRARVDGLVLLRVARDDVPGMDQAREVAEETEEDVDQRVSGAETALDPDYGAGSVESGWR